MRRLAAVVLSAVIGVLVVLPCAAVPLAVAPSGWDAPVLGENRLPDAAPDAARAAGAVTVLDESAIRASGARTLPELLARQAGVNVFDQDGGDFQPTVELRGFDATPVPATAVVVDGVRVNEPDFGQVNWQLIPLEDVARVEVLPGLATLYGKGALAGVISVTTKRAARRARPAVEAGASYGSFDRRRAWGAAQGTLRAFDWRVDAAREAVSGWRRGSDADVGTARVLGGWRPDPDTDLSLSYERADDRLDQAGSLTGAETAADPRQHVSTVRMVDSLDFVNGRLRRALPGDLSLAGDAHWRSRREATPENIGRASKSKSLSNTASRGGTLQLSRQGEVLRRAWTLSGGFEGGRDESDADSSGSFSGFPFTSGSLVKDDAMGVFAQAAADVVPESLTATAGWRYDADRLSYEDKVTPSNDGVAGFRHASPRLGLTWRPDPDWTLYASYAEAFRAPTALELTALGPFAAGPLNPVQTRSKELGLRAKPVEGGTFTLALFRADVVDEITFDPTAGAFGQNINVPRTRRLGLEWSAGLSRGAWEAALGHAYVESTFESDFTLSKAPLASQRVRKGDTMPMVPEQKGTLEVAFRPAPGWRLSADGLCVGNQRLVGDEANLEPQLPGYCVANLGASLERGDWTLALRGTNVTDAHYVQRGILSSLSGAAERFYVPAPGAGVQAALSWRWGATAAMTARRPAADLVTLARAGVAR